MSNIPKRTHCIWPIEGRVYAREELHALSTDALRRLVRACAKEHTQIEKVDVIQKLSSTLTKSQIIEWLMSDIASDQLIKQATGQTPELPAEGEGSVKDAMAQALTGGSGNPLDAVMGKLSQMVQVEAKKLADKMYEEMVSNSPVARGESLHQLAVAKAGEEVEVMPGHKMPFIGQTGSFIPKVDPDFLPEVWTGRVQGGPFDYVLSFAEFAKLFLSGAPILLFGPPGTGKTDAYKQLAAKLGLGYIRMQGKPELRNDHFVGFRTTKGNGIEFVDGPLPRAMLYENGQGCVFHLDEPFRAHAECLNTLHSVLEDWGKGPLCIEEDGGRVLSGGPNFRMAFSDNNDGYADTSGLYPDVRPQDYAMMSRIPAKIYVGWLEPALETKVVVQRTGAAKKVAEKMVKVANATREELSKGKGKLSIAVTMRHLLNWGRMIPLLGIGKAFALSTVNAFPQEQRATVVEIAQRVLGDMVDPKKSASQGQVDTEKPATATAGGTSGPF